MPIHPEDQQIAAMEYIGDAGLKLKANRASERKRFSIVGGDLGNDLAHRQLRKWVIKTYPKKLSIDPTTRKPSDVHADTGTRVTCVGNPAQQLAAPHARDTDVGNRVEDRPSCGSDTGSVALVVEDDHVVLSARRRHHGHPTRAARVEHPTCTLLNPEVPLAVTLGRCALDVDQRSAVSSCRGLRSEGLKALLQRAYRRQQGLSSPDWIRDCGVELALRQ